MGERDRGRSLLCPMSAAAVPETRLTRAWGARHDLRLARHGHVHGHAHAGDTRAQMTVGITEGRRA
jgi:hypothetical protein